MTPGKAYVSDAKGTRSNRCSHVDRGPTCRKSRSQRDAASSKGSARREAPAPVE